MNTTLWYCTALDDGPQAGGEADPDRVWQDALSAALALLAQHPTARCVDITVGETEPARIYPARGPDGELDLPQTRALAEAAATMPR